MKIKNKNMKFIEVEVLECRKLTININAIQVVKVDNDDNLIILTDCEDFTIEPGTHTYESLIKAIKEI